jgi:hypothetical protein
MVTQVQLTGLAQRNLETVVQRTIQSTGASALFVGCAYVSIYGAQFLRKLTQAAGINSVSLITDIRDAVWD